MARDSMASQDSVHQTPSEASWNLPPTGGFRGILNLHKPQALQQNGDNNSIDFQKL